MPVIVRNNKRNELRPMRWGLVPSWAQDRAIGQRMINARSETLLEKPFSVLTTGGRLAEHSSKTALTGLLSLLVVPLVVDALALLVLRFIYLPFFTLRYFTVV
jgi:hypothetical protein